MRKPSYAPDGFVYLAVNTPSAFREIMVRDNPAARSPAEREKVDALHGYAENRGTHIVRSSYSLGA